MDKEKIVSIIKDHAELAEDSLVDFIVACYKDYPKVEWLGQYPSQMSDVLMEVLINSIGGAQELADTITDKEGYFKFANFDKFNRDIANKDNAYSVLSNIFIPDLKRKYKIEPHMEFSISGVGQYPAYVNALNENGGLKMRLDYGLDGYVGVVVSRSVYPQASESAMSQPHLAFTAMNADKLSKVKLSTFCNNVECTVTTKIPNSDLEYEDPGLIYVPVKKFYDKVINRNLGEYGKCLKFTVLPKQVLTHYGLPILEKF